MQAQSHWLFSRDLSNGAFSPDNYKQINGGNIDVPIYEAKVTEQLRLVVGGYFESNTNESSNSLLSIKLTVYTYMTRRYASLYLFFSFINLYVS
jgi:hypothetical protein